MSCWWHYHPFLASPAPGTCSTIAAHRSPLLHLLCQLHSHAHTTGKGSPGTPRPRRRWISRVVVSAFNVVPGFDRRSFGVARRHAYTSLHGTNNSGTRLQTFVTVNLTTLSRPWRITPSGKKTGGARGGGGALNGAAWLQSPSRRGRASNTLLCCFYLKGGWTAQDHVFISEAARQQRAFAQDVGVKRQASRLDSVQPTKPPDPLPKSGVFCVPFRL